MLSLDLKLDFPSLLNHCTTSRPLPYPPGFISTWWRCYFWLKISHLLNVIFVSMVLLWFECSALHKHWFVPYYTKIAVGIALPFAEREGSTSTIWAWIFSRSYNKRLSLFFPTTVDGFKCQITFSSAGAQRQRKKKHFRYAVNLGVPDLRISPTPTPS